MTNKMKNPFQILEEMRELETKEEMIAYLRALPRVDKDEDT